jgi:hypothetical protein
VVSVGSPGRRFAVVLCGLFLLQVAWIVAVAPFRGADEFAHAVKASAVAHGDLSAHHAPGPSGWGDVMEASSDLVRRAEPVCRELPRMDDECEGEPAGPGTTSVATSAARYNPAYYAVVGLAGRPFGAIPSLYVMRATTALLCALLTALAITVLTHRARNRAPGTAALLVLLPTYAYSTTVVAPNGPEMAAAFLLWACLLRLVSNTTPQLPPRVLVPLAGCAAAILVTVRSLGPLWCATVVVTCALVAGRRRLVELARTRSVRLAAAGVGAVTAAAVAWTLAAGTNQFEEGLLPMAGSPWRAAVHLLPRWLQQAIAGGPAADEFAPSLVYALILSVVVVCLVSFFRIARGRLLVSWLLLAAFVVAVPVAFTVRTWHAVGELWQGRYESPVIIGLALVAAIAWEKTARPARPTLLPILVPMVLAAGQALTLVGVLHIQAVHGVGFADVGTAAPPAVVVVLLSVVGSLVVGWAVLGGGAATPTMARTDYAVAPISHR